MDELLSSSWISNPSSLRAPLLRDSYELIVDKTGRDPEKDVNGREEGMQVPDLYFYYNSYNKGPNTTLASTTNRTNQLPPIGDVITSINGESVDERLVDRLGLRMVIEEDDQSITVIPPSDPLASPKVVKLSCLHQIDPPDDESCTGDGISCLMRRSR
jgi:hypothetical protein